MYKYHPTPKTTIKQNTSYQGERIEEKINRIINNKEPITDGAPIIFTERKNGIEPQYNIKTDRFEIAIDAMDKVSKAYVAKREENIKTLTEKNTKDKPKTEPKTDGKPEPIQTTETK